MEYVRKQATTKFFFSFCTWILACENIRFSSLFAAGDVSRETDDYLFLIDYLDMVPRNSTPGGFAYIWQSKWVGIVSIKTERTQIHFLSDVLIAFAWLDLKGRYTRGILLPEHAPRARSGSKAPPCVPTISWVHFILGSRISTPQNASWYRRGVLLPGHAPGSFCTCQYTRGSVFKFAQFAPGPCSQIFNPLNIVEHFAGWKFCSRGWSVPMKSLVHTEELCSRSKIPRV